MYTKKLFESYNKNLNESLAEVIKNKDNSVTIINQFNEKETYSSIDEAISEYEDLIAEFVTEEDEESEQLAQDILDELYDIKN